jgi:3-methyladenine DNA glycosylase AlkD
MDLSNIDLTWAPPVLAFLSVLGIVAAMIRWLVKHYLDELKPNGGGSIKDQVNRLEKQHHSLDKKVDRIMEILITGRFKMPDTETIQTIDHQDEEPK